MPTAKEILGALERRELALANAKKHLEHVQELLIKKKFIGNPYVVKIGEKQVQDAEEDFKKCEADLAEFNNRIFREKMDIDQMKIKVYEANISGNNLFDLMNRLVNWVEPVYSKDETKELFFINEKNSTPDLPVGFYINEDNPNAAEGGNDIIQYRATEQQVLELLMTLV